MCHDFIGHEIMNNVSQQVMKGEKYTMQRVDIIIYIRGESSDQCIFWAKFRQLTDPKKKKAQCDLYKGFFWENFQKYRHIS